MEQKTAITEGYSSGNYDKHMSRNPAIRMVNNNFLSCIMRITSPLDAKKTLDIGCGEGFVINYIKKGNFVGMDLSKDALKIAKASNQECDFFEGDIYNIPFRDETFDLVMVLEVLEHLDKPEKALMEISRVSNEYCLLSVPNEPYFRAMNMLRLKYLPSFGNHVEHIQHWSSKAFVRLISARFEVVSIHKPYPWTVVLCKKK